MRPASPSQACRHRRQKLLAPFVCARHRRPMNFPQFWARATRGDFVSWRWSFQSLAEAQSLADQAVQELQARIKRGESPERHQGYYPGRPFREQMLREIRNGAGEVAAV